MTIGVFENVSYKEYEAWDALRQSDLKLLKRSPLHFKHNKDAGSEARSDVLLFGSALHSYVLEPATFEDSFFVAPKMDLRSPKNRELYADICQKVAPREILKSDAFDRIVEIAQVINKSNIFSWLLPLSQIELSVRWENQETKTPCKARLDLVSLQNGIAIDIKTTINASLSSFARSSWGYGYHNQGAWYLEGLRANSVEIEHYVIVAVEKDPPYGIAAYKLDADLLALGHEENQRLVKIYAECKTSGIWPGYSSEIQDLHAPGWVEASNEDLSINMEEF